MRSAVRGNTSLANVPTFTPLLATGDELEWTDQRDLGLGDGRTATVARCTIQRPNPAIAALTLGFLEGSRHEFQTLFAQVPETIGFIPDLLCHPRWRFAFDPARERPSINRLARKVAGLAVEYQPVPVGYPALRRRYRIEANADVGLNWLTQLFSPRFLDWLANQPPKGFGFELTSGWFVGFVALQVNWLGSDFDQLVTSSDEVTRALRDEALEERGLESAGQSARSDRGIRERRVRLQREADAVRWREPPSSRPAASKRFLRRLCFQPRFWVAALLCSLPLLAIWFIAFDGDARWWGTGLFALLFVLVLVYEMAKWKATELAQHAFADHYATVRRLRREDPRLFQARHIALNLTAVVDEALSGVKVGGRAGTLVLSHGTGHDSGSEYQALIVPLGGDVDESIVEPQLGPSGQLIRDRHLMTWMPLRDGEPSVESLDAFVEQTRKLYPSLLQA